MFSPYSSSSYTSSFSIFSRQICLFLWAYPSCISFFRLISRIYLPGPLCLPPGSNLPPLIALPGPSLCLALPCVGLHIWNKARQQPFKTKLMFASKNHTLMSEGNVKTKTQTSNKDGSLPLLSEVWGLGVPAGCVRPSRSDFCRLAIRDLQLNSCKHSIPYFVTSHGIT